MMWVEILAIVNCVLLIFAGIGLWLRVGYLFGRAKGMVNGYLRDVKAQHASFGILLERLTSPPDSPLTAPDIIAIKAPQTQRPIEDIDLMLGGARPTGNPISQDELDRLKMYAQWFREGRDFKQSDARDFSALADRMAEEREYSTNPGLVALIGISAFVLGWTLGAAYLQKDDEVADQ